MAKKNKTVSNKPTKAASKAKASSMTKSSSKPAMKAKAAAPKKADKKAAKAAPVKGAVKGALNTIKNLITGSKAAPKGAAKAAPAAKAAAPVKGAKGAKAAAPVAAPAPALTKKPKAEAGAKKASSGSSRKNAANVCREVTCESLITSGGYCRLHYIKNWKRIKRKEAVMKEGKLNQYIEELVLKYPEKYIEAIRQDLANDKEFMKVIRDLELDEAIDDFESESESVEGIVENVRRGEIDDDSDIF